MYFFIHLSPFSLLTAPVKYINSYELNRNVFIIHSTIHTYVVINNYENKDCYAQHVRLKVIFKYNNRIILARLP